MADLLPLSRYRVELHNHPDNPPWAAIELEACNAVIAAEVGASIGARARCSYAIARPLAPEAVEGPIADGIASERGGDRHLWCHVHQEGGGLTDGCAYRVVQGDGTTWVPGEACARLKAAAAAGAQTR